MDFIMDFSKKSETGNIVYLTCSKRGHNSQNWKGKAKYYKNTGKVKIYEQCKNDPNLHRSIDFDSFYENYKKNNLEHLDVKLRLYQKYYIKCLFLDNKIHNYTDAIEQLSFRFKEKFILYEDYIRKIKNEIFGGVNNLSIEELCTALKILDREIRIDIYPIKMEYKNKK